MSAFYKGNLHHEGVCDRCGRRGAVYPDLLSDAAYCFSCVITPPRHSSDLAAVTWEDSLPEPYSLSWIGGTTTPWGQLDCFCAGGGPIILENWRGIARREK